MAVAIRTVTTGTQTGGAASLTFSHTTNAGDKLLLCVGGRNGGTFVSSITYNGTSMTKVAESTYDLYATIYRLDSPDTGANNVVITWANSNDRPKVAYAVAVTGADDTTFVEASNSGGAGASTSHGTSVTTLTDGALVIDCIMQRDDGGGDSLTKDASQTEEANTSANGTYGCIVGVSSEAKATAGSVSMDWTSTASDIWEHVVVVVKPGAEAAASNNAMFHGGGI